MGSATTAVGYLPCNVKSSFYKIVWKAQAAVVSQPISQSFRDVSWHVLCKSSSYRGKQTAIIP